MTPTENHLDYAILTAGGWPRDLREKIVERSGVTADELVAKPELLKNTIGRHRQEVPEAFVPERVARQIGKLPEAKRPLAMQREALKFRDRQGMDGRACQRVMSRVGHRTPA